jgi:hypothetical protein
MVAIKWWLTIRSIECSEDIDPSPVEWRNSSIEYVITHMANEYVRAMAQAGKAREALERVQAWARRTDDQSSECRMLASSGERRIVSDNIGVRFTPSIADAMIRDAIQTVVDAQADDFKVMSIFERHVYALIERLTPDSPEREEAEEFRAFIDENIKAPGFKWTFENECYLDPRVENDDLSLVLGWIGATWANVLCGRKISAFDEEFTLGAHLFFAGSSAVCALYEELLEAAEQAQRAKALELPSVAPAKMKAVSEAAPRQRQRRRAPSKRRARQTA